MADDRRSGQDRRGPSDILSRARRIQAQRQALADLEALADEQLQGVASSGPAPGEVPVSLLLAVLKAATLTAGQESDLPTSTDRS